MQRLLLFLGFMAFGTGMIYLLTVTKTADLGVEGAAVPIHVLSMKQVVFRQQEGNDIKYLLTADQAVYNERSQITNLDTVNFTIYDNTQAGKGKVLMEGKAGGAMLDKGQGTVLLFGNVRLWDSEGTEIRSERLTYEEKRARIVSPGRVWIKARESYHQGDSLIYEIHKQKFTLTAPIFYQ